MDTAPPELSGARALERNDSLHRALQYMTRFLKCFHCITQGHCVYSSSIASWDAVKLERKSVVEGVNAGVDLRGHHVVSLHGAGKELVVAEDVSVVHQRRFVIIRYGRSELYAFLRERNLMEQIVWLVETE